MGMPSEDYEQQSYQYDNAQQQVIVDSSPVDDHMIEGHEVPWYFHEGFSWWWTGVFVPIVIAIIVNKQVKKFHAKKEQEREERNQLK